MVASIMSKAIALVIDRAKKINTIQVDMNYQNDKGNEGNNENANFIKIQQKSKINDPLHALLSWTHHIICQSIAGHRS